MAESQGVTLSMKELQAMMEAVVEKAIRISKEPTPKELAEQKELDEKKERFERSRQQAIQNMELDRRAREIQQERCPHKKENGKWATGGQVIGSRYGMLICQKCFKTWFAVFGQDVIQQLNSGDLTLHQADPTAPGWTAKPPMEEAA